MALAAQFDPWNQGLDGDCPENPLPMSLGNELMRTPSIAPAANMSVQMSR